MKYLKKIVNKMENGKEKLISIDSNYSHHSKQFSDALKRMEYNNKDRKTDFYNEKLFYSLNSKMKTVDIRAKGVDSQTQELNILVENYKTEMARQVKGLKEMEEDRVQALMDALNQMNIFQTNWDMNNKYDSNNFNEVVENISTADTVKEYMDLFDPTPLTKIDTYQSQVFDELLTNEDIKMHSISEEEEAKLSQILQKFIDKIDTEEINFTEFQELMHTKINRYLLVSILTKWENPCLPNMRSYDNMSKLINYWLKGCHKNDDSDYLKCIITIASRLYFDEEEADDAVIRTYITEGIRKNKIWDDSAIWGKAIFKDFRDILRKFKIPKDQENEVNRDEVLRNVLFNRFFYYIDKLSYFDMDKNILLTMVER